MSETPKDRAERFGSDLSELREVPKDQKPPGPLPDPKAAASIALLESWIAQAPTDPEAIREAEEDLLELKRALNLPRKETGARLHFPEVE